MDDPTDPRFISGIYNYCDRWCERCAFIDRCYLYHRDQARVEEHLRRGEDPDDPEIVMQDVHESLQEAMEMIVQMSEEQGIDLEAVEAEEEPVEWERPDRHVNPLHQRAERWSMRLGVIIDQIRADLPEHGNEEVGPMEGAESDPLAEERPTLAQAVADPYEVLLHYRFFIPVKLARATGSWAEAEAEKDHEFARFSRDDALGTAKLAYECLGKTIAALWRVGELYRPWMDMAMPIAMEGEALRHAIDDTFPDHRSFRRPGLDD